MNQAKDKYHIHSEVTLQDFLQLESIFSEVEETMDNDDLEGMIVSALTGALENVKAMRVQEGQELANDLQAQLNKLEKIVENVKQYAPTVVSPYKERLTQKLTEFIEWINR